MHPIKTNPVSTRLVQTKVFLIRQHWNIVQRSSVGYKVPTANLNPCNSLAGNAGIRLKLLALSAAFKVHWRDPDPTLMRAIHSKRQDAWQQVMSW